MSPPDPRYAAFFEWDTRNEEHLVRRGVTAREVEQVFTNGPTWRRNKRGRAAQYAMDGRTDAGRPLRVLVTLGRRSGSGAAGSNCVGPRRQVTLCHG